MTPTQLKHLTEEERKRIKGCEKCKCEQCRGELKRLATIAALRARVAALEGAIATAVSTIEGLANQQAMPDDGYLPTLAKLRNLIDATLATQPEVKR